MRTGESVWIGAAKVLCDPPCIQSLRSGVQPISPSLTMGRRLTNRLVAARARGECAQRILSETRTANAVRFTGKVSAPLFARHERNRPRRTLHFCSMAGTSIGGFP